MRQLPPLRFRPIFRQYLWGGRNLATELAKPIGTGENWAESWELVDRGQDQSVVEGGPLAGATLQQLVTAHGPELLGRHAPQSRFPLLFKFRDARLALSVQVHPDDSRAAQLIPPDLGKTEAWVILKADPGAVIYAGLKRGFDRPALEREVHRGTTELCLHRFQPRAGDCVFIPAGVVHALGAGLLVAEIQQSSDTTYRLHDWNRVDAEGRPRELHIARGLEAIDYQRGPVGPAEPAATDERGRERLVVCEKFVLDRWRRDDPFSTGGDLRFHILAVLEGAVEMDGLTEPAACHRGQVVLLPASAGRTTVRPVTPAVVMDAYLP